MKAAGMLANQYTAFQCQQFLFGSYVSDLKDNPRSQRLESKGTYSAKQFAVLVDLDARKW